MLQNIRSSRQRSTSFMILPQTLRCSVKVFPEARATVESEIESMLNGKEDVDTAVKTWQIPSTNPSKSIIW